MSFGRQNAVIQKRQGRSWDHVQIAGRYEDGSNGRRPDWGQKRRCVKYGMVRLIADGTLPLEKIATFAGLSYDEVKAVADSK